MKVFVCQEILEKRYSSLHDIFYAVTLAQRISSKLMLNTHSIYNVPLCVLKLKVAIFNTYCKFVNKKVLKYFFAYSYKEFFQGHTVHLDIIKVLSPDDTQENCFKRRITIYFNLLASEFYI
jgi:hypothetical protein